MYANDIYFLFRSWHVHIFDPYFIDEEVNHLEGKCLHIYTPCTMSILDTFPYITLLYVILYICKGCIGSYHFRTYSKETSADVRLHL